MMLIISLLPVVSTAANYSFTVSMTAKNSKVAAGSGVMITVKLSNGEDLSTKVNNPQKALQVPVQFYLHRPYS